MLHCPQDIPVPSSNSVSNLSKPQTRGILFSGAKSQGQEFKQSPPHVDIKNVWSFISIPICQCRHDTVRKHTKEIAVNMLVILLR